MNLSLTRQPSQHSPRTLYTLIDDGLEVASLSAHFWTGEERAILENVFTRPDKRRQGYGQALIERSCDDLRTQGFTRVELHAVPSAIRFYERCGFTLIPDAMTHTGCRWMRRELAQSLTD